MPPAWRVLLASALALVWLAGEGTAREPRSRRLYQQWTQADADQDGRLSRAEAAALKNVSPHFDAIDRNRDGFISAEEVRLWRSALSIRRRNPTPASGLGLMIARADLDADGRLDRTEVRTSFPRLAARFDEIDTDHDQRLTPQEIETWLARRRAVRSIGK